MKYFNYNYVFSVFSMLVLFISCASNKNMLEQSGDIQTDLIQKTIRNNFNEHDSIQIIPNKDDSWILYLSVDQPDLSIPIHNINFFVYDKITRNILYQNKYSRASIKWYNNNQLLLIRDLGFIDKLTGASTKFYIIDVKSKKIIEKIQNTKQTK